VSTDQPGPEGTPETGGEAGARIAVPASSAVDIPLTAENTLGVGAEPIRYTRQLIVVYLCLGAVMAGALVALVALVIQPGRTADPAWSSWKPKDGNIANMSKQIADRIAPRYRLSEDGEQLLAILPSPPVVTTGENKVPIAAIAIRKVPQSNAGIRILGTEKTRMYILCGLGENCSIDSGTGSLTRGRLTRREALETALYTFKFIPAVDQVIAFMPPAPGSATANVLFLEKNTLDAQLKEPLSKTLPLTTPPLPEAEDLREAATIDKLTLKNLFTYEYTRLQNGGAAIILDPSS
jgi:hypothetical protein